MDMGKLIINWLSNENTKGNNLLQSYACLSKSVQSITTNFLMMTEDESMKGARKRSRDEIEGPRAWLLAACDTLHQIDAILKNNDVFWRHRVTLMDAICTSSSSDKTLEKEEAFWMNFRFLCCKHLEYSREAFKVQRVRVHAQ